MNILFLTHAKLDWLCDYVFQGLLAAGHQVVHFPPKPAYQTESKPDSQLSDHQAIVKSFHPETAATRAEVEARLRSGGFDMIFCTAKTYATTGRFFSDALRHAKHRLPSRRDDLGWRQLLTLPVPANVPVAVLDGRDPDTLTRDDVALLQRADIFFKREIPPDSSAVMRELTPELQRAAAPHLKKLRPVCFGINVARFREFYPERCERKYDVAFLMNPGHHPLRQRVFEELQKLKGEFNIYMSEGGARTGLAIGDYYRVIKQSRVTLSVSGWGWDCLRHYEAVACDSVLMADAPTIQTRNFFRDGESAILFKPDLSDFAPKLRACLRDEKKLAAMTAAAAAHLEKFLDVKPLAEGLVQETLRGRPN